MKLIFWMQISMEVSYKLILWFLMGMVKHSQILSLECLKYLKKEVRDEVGFFCMQINIKVSSKLISTLWASKFSTRWYYHYWWAWPSTFKVLKVSSLQYPYNISKKKLGMEFIFCMHINVKVSTSWYYCF